MQAKEFFWQDSSQVLLEEKWIAAYMFEARAVIEKVGDGLVQEATWAGLGFQGEVWSVASGVLGGEGVLDCELHGYTGGASDDGDILLGWFFRGDGAYKEGVIMSIRGLGNSIVVSGAVAKE